MTDASAGRRLRDLLAAERILVMPGAYNALIARLIEARGFEAVYVSGAGSVNANLALPDNGLATLSEMAGIARLVSAAVSIPAFSDADTGFGNADNVARTVHEFEAAGVAGIHIEDQVFPKRCGHLPGKDVVPIEEMSEKIEAATEARNDPDFMIVARVDALSVEGLTSAVKRANAYVEAGADAVFPEALRSEEDFLAFRDAHLGVPLVGNLTEFGVTPYLSADKLQELGFDAALFPVSALRVTLKYVDDFLKTLYQTGTQGLWVDTMFTRDELYHLIDYHPPDGPAAGSDRDAALGLDQRR